MSLRSPDPIDVVVDALPDRWWNWSAYELAARILDALDIAYAPLGPNNVGPSSAGSDRELGSSTGTLAWSPRDGSPPTNP